MRVASFGLLPGQFSAATQARLDRMYPEKMYFGWGDFSGKKMTALFSRPDIYQYFVSTFGREPYAVFRDTDFDLDPVAAGKEPAYSRIMTKLTAIDPDLAAYHGPILGMSGGPAVDFGPDSPAYTGVGSSTIDFNTPGGVVTVVNGVPTGGGGTGANGGTKTKTESADNNTMLLVGIGLAGVAAVLLLSSKGN